jgi:hypothetical protein
MKSISLTVISVCATLLWAGAVRAQPRFIDNGDGTISDTKTGLMWEKKTGKVGRPRARRARCEQSVRLQRKR